MKNSILIVLPTLAVVCGVALFLPVVLVEPDDYDWYSGMISFSRGHFVSSEEEVREIRDEMAERFGHGEFHFPLVRNEKGFVHERSPGYYGFLALFYLLGLAPYTNVFLAVACVLFFSYFLKKYAGERIAVGACLLMIFNPTFLTGLYRVYMSDFAYFVFGLFAMGAYWIAREKGNSWLYALAGFLLSASVIFRVTNAIFFVSIVLYELCVAVFRKAFGRLGGNVPAADSSESPIGEGGREAGSVFALRYVVPLAIGLIVGIVPLLLYNYHTMGNLLAAGYSSRFSHEGSRYFSLFGPNAIFSLRNLGYTFPVGLPRLLQGYPIVVLAPAGFLLLARRRNGAGGIGGNDDPKGGTRVSDPGRGRFALFMGLWFAAYWAFYLCYSTIREDSFQFMCRKFLPSLPPLCVGAAAFVEAIRGRWKIITLATFAIFGIAVASEFMVRFVVPQPFGRPVFPRREPPPEAFRNVADRLRRIEELLDEDAEEALRPLRNCVLVLKDLAQTMPGPVGAELGDFSASLHELERKLNESVKKGKGVSREQITEWRELLRETRRKLERIVPPAPVLGPFGPPGAPRVPPDAQMRVRLLHRLIDQAEADGADTWAASLLDELARIEIERGRFGEAMEFLDAGIELLGGAPPFEGDEWRRNVESLPP